MRFYKNGEIINVGVSNDPYILETPFKASDVEGLFLRQINDVVYICHPDYPQHKLLRYADDSWGIQQIDFSYPPFLDQNVDDTITLTPSNTSGGITIEASTGVFHQDMVGGFFRIGHIRGSG